MLFLRRPLTLIVGSVYACFTLLAGCNTTLSSDATSAVRAASTTPGDSVRLAALGAIAEPDKEVKIGYMLARDMQYEVPLPKLLAAFVREFGDGTVIDKVMVTPVQDSPRDKPTYYLVGMGQYNGQFRAMALPLRPDANRGLYLSTAADRHIAQGFSCGFCYFSFNRGRVSGVDCSEAPSASIERRCSYRTEPRNRLFSE